MSSCVAVVADSALLREAREKRVLLADLEGPQARLKHFHTRASLDAPLSINFPKFIDCFCRPMEEFYLLDSQCRVNLCTSRAKGIQ
eukprot:621326-Amphidinium_carterae.2